MRRPTFWLGFYQCLIVGGFIVLAALLWSRATRTEDALRASLALSRDQAAQVVDLRARLVEVLDAVDQLRVTGEAERQEYYNARFRWDAEQNLERLIASDRIAVLEGALYDERQTWEMVLAARAKYAELACHLEGSHPDCAAVYAGIRGRR